MTTELYTSRTKNLLFDEDLGTLVEGNVVLVRGTKSRVFDSRDGDMMTFYFMPLRGEDMVMELTTPIQNLEVREGYVHFVPSEFDRRVALRPEDGVRYHRRMNDLIALGLVYQQ